MVKQILYPVFAKVARQLFKDKITGKEYLNYNKTLYYDKSQHLGFLLKNKINYESLIQNRIKKYIKTGDTIFDIGSNIGQYAMIFSEIVGPNGKVICYEPDEKNLPFLNFNKLRNKCRNIQIVDKGLGPEVGTLGFYRDSQTGGRTSSFKKEFVRGEGVELSEGVKITTLDSEINQHGVPSFIKIDVEGFEDEVIKGFTKKLNSTVILIEVRGESKKVIFDFFTNKGYNICEIIDEPKLRVVKDESEIPDFSNLLFRKQ